MPFCMYFLTYSVNCLLQSYLSSSNTQKMCAKNFIHLILISLSEYPTSADAEVQSQKGFFHSTPSLHIISTIHMEIPQRCEIASGLDVSGKFDLPNLIYLAYLHFNGFLPEKVIVSSRWTAMVLLSHLHSSAHLSVSITLQYN